jgi:hypothetical protein
MNGNGYLQVDEWKGIATFLIRFPFRSLQRIGTPRIAGRSYQPAAAETRLTLVRRHALQSRLREIEAEYRSRSLPSREVSELLLRYDRHVERQMYRAMGELERIQRRRKGDIVPPPISSVN